MKNLSDECNLCDRYKKVLINIVDNYILTAMPVGSRTISKNSSLSLSAATIRNVMSDLEEMGYIFQPHVSAGRIPSAKGYRFFVENLLVIQDELVNDVVTLDSKIDSLKRQFADEKKLLSEVGNLVSSITDCVSLIAFEKNKNISIKKVSIVKIAQREIMVVLVLSDCEIFNTVMKINHELKFEVLEKVEKYLNLNFSGIKIDKISEQIDEIFSKNIEGLEEFRNILKDSLIQIQNVANQENLRIMSVNKEKIFDIPDFSDLSKIKAVINYVESKNNIKNLLKDVEGITVKLGMESNNLIPENISVISAHINEMDGYLSLIGPTRMNYRKNLSTLLNVINKLK